MCGGFRLCQAARLHDHITLVGKAVSLYKMLDTSGGGYDEANTQEMNNLITAMTEAKVELPAVAQRKLLGLRLVRMIQKFDDPDDDALDDFVRALSPFPPPDNGSDDDGEKLQDAGTNTKFDPFSPEMSQLEDSPMTKFPVVLNIWVDDVLTYLMKGNGDEHSTLVHTLSSRFLKEYEHGIADMDLVPDSAVHLLTICRCLVTMRDPSLPDPDYASVASVFDAGKANANNKLADVAYLIKTNPFYEAELSDILKRQADLSQHMPKLRAARLGLSKLSVDGARCFEAAKEMVQKVVELRPLLRTGATSPLEVELLTVLEGRFAMLRDPEKHGRVPDKDPTTIEAAASCVNLCMTLWGSSEKVKDWHKWCFERLDQAKSEQRLGNLSRQLRLLQARLGELGAGFFAELDAIVERCVAGELGAGLEGEVKDFVVAAFPKVAMDTAEAACLNPLANLVNLLSDGEDKKALKKEIENACAVVYLSKSVAAYENLGGDLTERVQKDASREAIRMVMRRSSYVDSICKVASDKFHLCRGRTRCIPRRIDLGAVDGLSEVIACSPLVLETFSETGTTAPKKNIYP